ncbi:hypothetical protein BBP40_002185 [Aspergillus hancockii]|nr:hypothetical protein BBP40_002185 [Aspergillus hancockii]
MHSSPLPVIQFSHGQKGLHYSQPQGGSHQRRAASFSPALARPSGHMGDLSFFLWDGGDDEAVAAMSMPVFILLQVADSMVTVKHICKEEKEHEEGAKRNLILIILSAVLLIIPFVAEVVGAMTGSAWIAGAAALADVSASIALVGYDIVKDPKSAPMELLNILLFAGSGRAAKNLSKAAEVRRGIKKGELAKFGSVFKENDDALHSLIRFCRK